MFTKKINYLCDLLIINMQIKKRYSFFSVLRMKNIFLESPNVTILGPAESGVLSLMEGEELALICQV